MRRALSAVSRAASSVALPPITVLRLDHEPTPSGIRSVSPWITWMRSIATPSVSETICASTVSMPWPDEAPPASTRTVPSTSTSMPAVS